MAWVYERILILAFSTCIIIQQLLTYYTNNNYGIAKRIENCLNLCTSKHNARRKNISSLTWTL